MLDIIIPAYNEEKMIRTSAGRILSIMRENSIDCRLIFIDDGSADKTWSEISELAVEHSNVHGISFSRNFGKEAAILAGLNASEGDCAVVIDCDLQHPPERIPDMYRLWEQGYEIVEGLKSDRGKESFMHSLAAKLFYSMINKASGTNISNASDFKLLDRIVVDALVRMPEKNRFFRALSTWTGFKTTAITYDVQEREQGESKWSFIALARYALNNITSFSAAPMHISIYAGMLVLIAGLILFFIPETAYTLSTVILIQCLTCAITMISMGIMGYYVGKIHQESKNRPDYIIREITK